MAKGQRVTHIQLENWRNFRSVDVELRGRAFIVGPNASGKSNFIDALRFLRDVAMVGGGFQSAVARKRGGVAAIRCLAARSNPNITVAVTVGDDEAPAQWHYELSFSSDSHRRPIIRREVVVQRGTTILRRPDPEDAQDPERLTQTYLEQVNANRGFRDLVDFLNSVHYYHVVPQLIRDPDRSVGIRDDPYGGDFLERVAQTPKPTQQARLRRVRDALRVAVPQLTDLELIRDERGGPHLRGRYQHWRPRGAWQTEDQFSDGTLRLLGLLWATLDGTGPLLLEEPELSLHAEVVRYLPQLFARVNRRVGRQLIISTHASMLLQDEGIGLDEVLLLNPTPNGTQVTQAGTVEEIEAMLSSGVLSLPEVIMPRTRPADVAQLGLFG